MLFLSELFYPHGSGAELATYLYAKLLSEKQHKVIVITNQFAGEPVFSRQDDFFIYRLPLYEKVGHVKYSILSRVDILFSTLIKKMLNWTDVLYVPRFWFSAIPLAKAYGKPVITHLHDFIPVCPLASKYNLSKNSLCNSSNVFCSPKCTYCYEKTANRVSRDVFASVALNSTIGNLFSKFIWLSDAIICVSEKQKEILLKNSLYSSPNNVFVVHNPVPNYPKIPMVGDAFGYFGGLDKMKGFQVLARTLSTISGNPDYSVTVHSTKIPLVSESLKRSLSQLGFIIHGKLSLTQYAEMYRSIRGVVVPSIWPEPWPYIVVEALLNGRYVIASNIGGIPEQVETCKGVKLVEPGNVNQLKTAILDVLSLKKESLLDLGYKNNESFKKRFSNEKSLKAFIDISNSIL